MDKYWYNRRSSRWIVLMKIGNKYWTTIYNVDQEPIQYSNNFLINKHTVCSRVFLRYVRDKGRRKRNKNLTRFNWNFVTDTKRKTVIYYAINFAFEIDFESRLFRSLYRKIFPNYIFLITLDYLFIAFVFFQTQSTTMYRIIIQHFYSIGSWSVSRRKKKKEEEEKEERNKEGTKRKQASKLNNRAS